MEHTNIIELVIAHREGREIQHYQEDSDRWYKYAGLLSDLIRSLDRGMKFRVKNTCQHDWVCSKCTTAQRDVLGAYLYDTTQLPAVFDTSIHISNTPYADKEVKE